MSIAAGITIICLVLNVLGNVSLVSILLWSIHSKPLVQMALVDYLSIDVWLVYSIAINSYTISHFMNVTVPYLHPLFIDIWCWFVQFTRYISIMLISTLISN